jgi:hypothetical protein
MAPTDEPVGQHASSTEDLPGLPVLARLPEVSMSSRAPFAEQVDWIKKLDWKRLRKMNFDPNWVAGGVLALVLVLLLVITLNRTPKPVPEAAATSEAPSWKKDGKSNAPTTLTATPNVAAAGPAGAGQGGINSGAMIPNSAVSGGAPGSPNAGSGAFQAPMQQAPSSSQPLAASPSIESQQAQISLQGVFYPRTPYPAPAGNAINQAMNQPVGGSLYGRELRTAQRDVLPSHQAPVQATSPQSGRAQLEGIITQP